MSFWSGSVSGGYPQVGMKRPDGNMASVTESLVARTTNESSPYVNGIAMTGQCQHSWNDDGDRLLRRSDAVIRCSSSSTASSSRQHIALANKATERWWRSNLSPSWMPGTSVPAGPSQAARAWNARPSVSQTPTHGLSAIIPDRRPF